MNNDLSYKKTYAELLKTFQLLGYPEELGRQVAKNLGSEKLLHRMTVYLLNVQPKSAEEIVDEMLGLMEDRNRWKDKKETEYYNARYNEYLERQRWRSDDE